MNVFNGECLCLCVCVSVWGGMGMHLFSNVLNENKVATWGLVNWELGMLADQRHSLFLNKYNIGGPKANYSKGLYSMCNRLTCMKYQMVNYIISVTYSWETKGSPPRDQTQRWLYNLGQAGGNAEPSHRQNGMQWTNQEFWDMHWYLCCFFDLYLRVPYFLMLFWKKVFYINKGTYEIVHTFLF